MIKCLKITTPILQQAVQRRRRLNKWIWGDLEERLAAGGITKDEDGL